jgi:aspartokinase/homoserine dehydrogenase 1
MNPEFDPKRWVIHKFGGTSVGNADCMRLCIDIITPIAKKQRIAVVVSAMGGKPKVTDLLLDLVHAAANGRSEEITTKMHMIRVKHIDCVESLLTDAPDIANQILQMINTDLKNIDDLLRAVRIMRMAHSQILELVSGYGEIWSASIVQAALQIRGLPFIFLNARDVLFIEEHATMGTKVCWDMSIEKLQLWLQNSEQNWLAANLNHKGNNNNSDIPIPHLVITGYIASTLEGVATTLKRDGSDFSASIFDLVGLTNKTAIPIACAISANSIPVA